MSMITIKTQVDVEELLEEIGLALLDNMPTTDIEDFIKRLDDAAHSWDMTLRLADHFDGMRAAHAKEEAAIASENAQRQGFLSHARAAAFEGKP